MAEETNKKDNVEELRTFEGPNGKMYKIVAPTADDIRGADWNYSKTFTKSLVEGITTAAELQDILRMRGIIGPNFEKRAEELATNLNEKILEMQNEKDNATKRSLAEEVSEIREELFQWNQRLNGPMSNTCEQLSDDARVEYLTSRMVTDENLEKVWDSYDAYLVEKDNALAVRARYNVMLYLQGLDTDFMDYVPEAIAVREIEESIAKEVASKQEEERAAEEEVESKEGSVKTSKKKVDKKDK